MTFQNAVEKLEGLIGKYSPKPVRDFYVVKRLNNQLGKPSNTTITGFSPLEILTAIPTAAIVAFSPSLVHGDEVYGPEAIGLRTPRGYTKYDFEGQKESIKQGATFTIAGIRYSVNRGSNIVAPADGYALFVEADETLVRGPRVWLDHGSRYISLIYHLDDGPEGVEKFKPDSYVKRGQFVGKSGVQTLGSGPRSQTLHSYSHSFGRANEEGKIEWINPDKHGENGGRLKLYGNREVQDKISLEERVFYKDIISMIHKNLNDTPMPSEISDYFNKPRDFDLFRNSIFDLSKIKGLLEKHENSFKPGTMEQYEQIVNKMLAPGLSSPVVLTHTYGKAK